MATQKKYTIDLEWHIPPPHGFRLGSITNGVGKVKMYTTLPAFVKALTRLPKDTVLGGHYVVADLGQIVKWGQGYALPKTLHLEDTVIASRLLFNHAQTKTLKVMAAEFGMWYENRGTEALVGEEETDDYIEYCAKDSWASHYLWPALTATITEQTRKVLEINNEFQKAFFAVELAGLKFDMAKAQREEQRLLGVLSDCVSQLPVGLAPTVATDDNELRAWLQYNYSQAELKLFPLTKSKKELSVGVDYMRTLGRRPEGFDALLLARETQSFLSMYVQGKQRFLDEQHFLYPSYQLLVAKTHRRSTKPSIQNWPKEAREFIISRWTGGRIVWGDFKQLEARLFAWQCGSKQMMADLIERGYLGIASRVYGLDVEKNSDAYKLVKATVLASQYNMGAGKLRLKILMDHNIHISYKEAEAKRDKLFNTYPEIYMEHRRRIDYAWAQGETWSDVGAPVPLYLMPDSYYPADEMGFGRTPRQSWEVKQVDNFSINYPTQQMAGYVTGCALLSMQEALAKEHGGWGQYLSDIHDSTKGGQALQWMPIAEVHDELVTDSRMTDMREQYAILKHHMEVGLMQYLKPLCPHFDCPLEAEIEDKEYWTKS